MEYHIFQESSRWRESRDKRVRSFVRSIAYLLLFFGVLWIAISLMEQLYTITLLVAVMIGIAYYSLHLIRSGSFLVAKNLIFASVTAYFLVVCIFFDGPGANEEQGIAYFWFLVLAIYFYFIHNDMKPFLRDLISLSLFTLFFLFHFRYLSFSPLVHLKQKELINKGTLLTALLATYILTRQFAVQIIKSEEALSASADRLQEQQAETQKQKQLIEEKQKEILKSISYAKRLQEAILPPQEFVDTHLANNFIYYQPKDIVAGDFYWAEKVGEVFFIAAADSTGHGVPGAMVSVVCSNALNRTIKEFKLTDTGKILDKTRELVIETFEKSASDVKDGMDISLLSIDFENKKIFWSGANNPLWYIQNSELNKIKADKQPIGKADYQKPFTTHQIAYIENTTFYLFTDGFADQFGGPKGQKFKYNQFSDLLLKNNNLPQKQQAEIINKTLLEWKGDLEQVDDVCVIGIKL